MQDFIKRFKYEILLVALIQHLFIGIFLSDLPFYTRVIWPINMLVLGVASIGVFTEKGKWKKWIRNALFVLVLVLPLGLPLVWDYSAYYLFLNVAYVLFFCFIFYEVILFLVRPSYINKDIISASVGGYLLLVEISTFLFQYFFTWNPESFTGVNTRNIATTYMDFVYFSSITLTSIGYGDISPGIHQTKLIVSLFGIAGQFYTVVLVGILISKFSTQRAK